MRVPVSRNRQRRHRRKPPRNRYAERQRTRYVDSSSGGGGWTEESVTTETTPGDYDGVFNYLGTADGTETYVSPHCTHTGAGRLEIGVEVSGRWSGSYNPLSVLDREHGDFISENSGSPWYMVDFGPFRRFAITDFSIKPRDANLEPRELAIEASDDKDTWVELAYIDHDYVRNVWHTESIADAGAYRYIRVVGNLNASSGVAYNIREMEWYGTLEVRSTMAGLTNAPTVVSPDAANGFTDGAIANGTAPTVTVSSTRSGSYDKDDLVNQSYSTTSDAACWASATEASPWAKFDFTTAREFNAVAIKTRSNSDYPPHYFTIQGSNNDSDWDDLRVVSDGAELDFVHQWYVYWFDTGAAAPYRYYRLQGDVTVSGDGQIFILDEVEFLWEQE